MVNPHHILYGLLFASLIYSTMNSRYTHDFMEIKCGQMYPVFGKVEIILKYNRKFNAIYSIAHEFYPSFFERLLSNFCIYRFLIVLHFTNRPNKINVAIPIDQSTLQMINTKYTIKCKLKYDFTPFVG